MTKTAKARRRAVLGSSVAKVASAVVTLVLVTSASSLQIGLPLSHHRRSSVSAQPPPRIHHGLIPPSVGCRVDVDFTPCQRRRILRPSGGGAASSVRSRHAASITALGMASSANGDVNVGSDRVARVTLVSGTAPSLYGKTSPEPDPPWSTVCDQLARRLPNFAGTTSNGQDLISAKSMDASTLEPGDLTDVDVVVALGVSAEEEERRFGAAVDAARSSGGSLLAVLPDPTCGKTTFDGRFAGSYAVSSSLDSAIATLIPWSAQGTGQRLLKKTDTLLTRKSTEDYIFAILLVIHSLGIATIDVVKSDLNPSWEKGPIRNVKEFAKMIECCRPQIIAAVSDPQTKEAIDLLNEVDLRDQVGSYRVIVSNETPQLEDFTLCILQRNDCFGCDAPILERPKVPILKEWRGKQLDQEAARQIWIGHLDHPEANQECSHRKPWSWKIVVGANPAYDAFPMQHQIFYPSGGGKGGGKPSALWYDPVFCVETLQGELVWCKRHYRCTPRRHWSADEKVAGGDAQTGKGATTPGAWTLTTLDNGMVSEEKWTTVDAADDLSWAVLHYSGAARRAGQSYVGALLCSPDGLWPEKFKSGEGLERIREAFRKCDLELWELFGGSTDTSYMWSEQFTDWAEGNPPPLDRIGDISITRWREREREKELEAKKKERAS